MKKLYGAFIDKSPNFFLTKRPIGLYMARSDLGHIAALLCIKQNTFKKF